MEQDLAFSDIPNELIVEMVWLVPRAYGALSGLSRRYYRALRAHLDRVKTLACVRIVGKNRVYWYLPNGDIHIKMMNYFESGNLRWETEYRDNKRHGKSIGYYETGVVMWEMEYDNGLRRGKRCHYYQNGLPWSSNIYDDA
ncbi:toxin-antitoxin system YwqK [Faustovirus]|nr:toxin-antitoxin system YwqK [Faustovirus]